jgi:hypothetical protein
MKFIRTSGLIILLIMCRTTIFAQSKGSLPSLDSIKHAALNYLVSNPDLLNDEMAKYLAALKNKNEKTYDFIRDLNLSFKTFQADNQPPGLGFGYQYDNSWTKINTSADFSQSFNVNLDGNVAFKKVYNPDNFLESKVLYNGSFFWGGFAKKNTPAEVKQLRQIVLDYSQAIATGNDAQRKALKAQMDQLTALTDQYYLGINGDFSYESNQDFSKRQFVPGVLVNIGAKAWNKNGTLRWFNLPDYPFAVIRMLTGSDFNISGASFPSALFGLDYVIPGQDSLRQAVTGALSPFTRVRFEAAFKTEAAAIGKQVIWFSADYRWYRQLGASAAIINAHIDQFNYFTCNLASNNGFFVSYTCGQLPFDKKSSNVYGIGFNYNLGNWR